MLRRSAVSVALDPDLTRRPSHARSSASRTRPSLSRRITALALPVLFACAAGFSSPSPPATSTSHPRAEFWAFTAFWDPRSKAALSAHARDLDATVTTWVALDTATSLPRILHRDPTTRRRRERRTMMMVTSWNGSEFHPASVRRLGGDSTLLARVAHTVANAGAADRMRGAVLDFEDHEPADLPALLRVMRTLADTLHARRLGPVTVAIPAADTLAYPARAFLDAGADYVMPMLYDQHWSGGSAGPVAAPAWAEQALRTRVGEAGASRVVAALPLYGYQWPRTGKGKTVTFAEATRAARDAGTTLRRDSSTATLRAQLPDSGDIWVSDAALLQRLVRIGQSLGVHRFALWHIGQEDPGVWRVIARARRR